MRRIAFALIVCVAALPAFADGVLHLPKADAVFPKHDMAEIALGRLLFYDPILSGNRQVACATCHHSRFGTSDGLSLGLGDGAMGLGSDRKVDADNHPEERVPRNSPALFNLGAEEFAVMFHDGRLEADATRPSGLRTPLEDEMVMGFDSVLSAQAMFPVLSPDEMAGHYSENDVSQAVRQGFLTIDGGAWDIISKRVADIPAYRTAFDAVIGADAPILFTDISNAIAAFISFEWRADDSPFDRYLRDGTPMETEAMAGMELFYGKADCSSCHAGQFQTDHGFHAIAMPQIGPGKKNRFETDFADMGRMEVTGFAKDAYKFRTPSLRNISHTAPYGHSGAFASLEDVVRHHLDPIASFKSYDPAQAILPELSGHDDFVVLADTDELARISAANQIQPIALSALELNQILAFLKALDDPQSVAGRLGVPAHVPSGLPVDQ